MSISSNHPEHINPEPTVIIDALIALVSTAGPISSKHFSPAPEIAEDTTPAVMPIIINISLNLF